MLGVFCIRFGNFGTSDPSSNLKKSARSTTELFLTFPNCHIVVWRSTTELFLMFSPKTLKQYWSAPSSFCSFLSTILGCCRHAIPHTQTPVPGPWAPPCPPPPFSSSSYRPSWAQLVHPQPVTGGAGCVSECD